VQYRSFFLLNGWFLLHADASWFGGVEKEASYEPTEAKVMMLHRQRAAWLGLALLVLLANGVTASPLGLGSEANEGCMCHTLDTTTSVALTGLPEAYEANMSYALTLTVDGSVESQEGQHQGGFRMLVSNGTVQADESEVQFLDGGWTHTEAGSYKRTWSFTWISPNDNTSRTDFVVHGNVVNGNNAPTGDGWNSFETVLPGVAFEGDLTPDEGIDGLSSTDRILLGVALLVLVGLLWSSIRS
jgi:hypothetical protein